MFADDQTLCVSGVTIDEVDKKIHEDVLPISAWVLNNAMSINTSKTKCMVVASRPKVNQLSDCNVTLNVRINDTDIPNVLLMSFLASRLTTL